MKKLFSYGGYGFIALSLIFLIGSEMIVTSDSASGPTRDLLGLVIPNPPMWISYVPYLGGFLQFLWSFFSLHGLVVVTIAGIGASIGMWLVSLSEKDVAIPIKTNKAFKPDFGLHLKDQMGASNSNIILTESFSILSLVLYPDQNSSITAEISGKLATFDFDDDILKVFLYILKSAGLVEQQKLSEQVRNQVDQPIFITFDKVKALIAGVVLTCKLGQKDKSLTTNEDFIPLVIESIKIVQEPALTIINTTQGGIT